METIEVNTSGPKVGDVLDEQKDDVETTSEYEPPEKTETASETDLLDGPLRYPLDHQDRYQAFIKFSQYEIEAATGSDATQDALEGGINATAKAVSTAADESSGFLDFAGGLLSDAGDAISDAIFGDDEEPQDAASVDGKDPDSSPIIVNRRVTGKGDPITLYLPTALTFNDGLQYDKPALGLAGATAFEAASQGGGMLEALGNAITQEAKSMSEMFSGSASVGDLARLGSIRAMSRLPGAGALQEGASIAFGVTLNPNVRASFKGVTLREFTFQFKFIPKSKEESKVVEDIIKRFRYAAYPNTIALDGTIEDGDASVETSLSAGYKYPDLFDIQVKYKTKGGEVRVGNKFQKCFLQSISTNYNPGSMSFHKDGKPVEIDLTLNFVEEKPIDRNSITQGY